MKISLSKQGITTVVLGLCLSCHAFGDVNSGDFKTALTKLAADYSAHIPVKGVLRITSTMDETNINSIQQKITNASYSKELTGDGCFLVKISQQQIASKKQKEEKSAGNTETYECYLYNGDSMYNLSCNTQNIVSNNIPHEIKSSSLLIKSYDPRNVGFPTGAFGLAYLPNELIRYDAVGIGADVGRMIDKKITKCDFTIDKTSNDTSFEVTAVGFDDTQNYSLKIKLSPSKGNLLQKFIYTETFGDTYTRTDTVVIDDAKEVFSGFWYPMSGTHTVSLNGKLQFTDKFKISSVVIDDKTLLTAEDFTIPPRTFVNDKVKGEKFTTGEKPSILNESIAKWLNAHPK